MTDAVASTAIATAPRERGWRWFILALATMFAITSVPLWPPALALLGGLVRLVLPIEQFALLAVVGIASCAVVGWWSGGRLAIAVITVVIAGWLLWKAPLASSGYGAFARGWAMVLGSSFGLVCLATASRPFLTRAVTAVSIAGVVTILGFAFRSSAGTGMLDAPSSMLAFEYQRRMDEALGSWRKRTDSPTWKAFAARMPEAAATAERSAVVISTLSQAGGAGSAFAGGGPRGPSLVLAPAFLALESVLALALGWAGYHRLSRARIGPPLGDLRDLRFNDQWIWALVVGFTLLLLPTLAEWRSAGLNIVGFFGLFYVARGIGVIVWWVPDRWASLLPIALVLLIPLVGPVQVLVVVSAIAFGIGVSDTWRDFRSSAASRRPVSPS